MLHCDAYSLLVFWQKNQSKVETLIILHKRHLLQENLQQPAATYQLNFWRWNKIQRGNALIFLFRSLVIFEGIRKIWANLDLRVIMVVSRRTLLLCHHHNIVLGAVAAKRLCSTSQPVSFETSLWVEQPSKVNWDAQFKMAKEELPAVFHMKPLNNWPNETKIMNNVCRCQCHTFEQKEDWWQNLKHTMIVKVKKKRVLMAIIGLSCFIFGLAIPLLFIGNSFSTSEPASTERPSFASLVHFRNRERHHVDSAVVNTTLDNVFISVKTTKQYHYPRVIIQLETWVSLVKSQVSFLFAAKKPNMGEKWIASFLDLVLHRYTRCSLDGAHQWPLDRHQLLRKSFQSGIGMQDGCRIRHIPQVS